MFPTQVKTEPCESKYEDRYLYTVRLPNKEEYETTFHFQSKKVALKRRKTGPKTTRGIAREPPPEERQLRGHFKSPCTLTIDTNEPNVSIVTYCMHKYGKDPKSSRVVNSVPFYLDGDVTKVVAHTIAPDAIEFYTKGRKQYFDFEFGEVITVSTDRPLQTQSAVIHHRVANKMRSISLVCEEVKSDGPSHRAAPMMVDEPVRMPSLVLTSKSAPVKQEAKYSDCFSDDEEVEIVLSPVNSPLQSSRKRKYTAFHLPSEVVPVPPLELDGYDEPLPPLSHSSSSSEEEDLHISPLSPGSVPSFDSPTAMDETAPPRPPLKIENMDVSEVTISFPMSSRSASELPLPEPTRVSSLLGSSSPFAPHRLSSYPDLSAMLGFDTEALY